MLRLSTGIIRMSPTRHTYLRMHRRMPATVVMSGMLTQVEVRRDAVGIR